MQWLMVWFDCGQPWSQIMLISLTSSSVINTKLSLEQPSKQRNEESLFNYKHFSDDIVNYSLIIDDAQYKFINGSNLNS